MSDVVIHTVAVLVGIVISTKETIFRDHALLRPSSFVLLQHIVDDMRLVNRVVVPKRQYLTVVQQVSKKYDMDSPEIDCRQ